MASAHDVWEDKLQDPNATPMSLPLEFLKAITRDFSADLLLGEGGFGAVYKGVLRSGETIAVKKLFEAHLKEETFQNEVRYLMGIKHQNVVQFVGYCSESSWELKENPSERGKHIVVEIPKRLLCFEYVSNKSLNKHISDESSGLEWNMRYEIIKGICNGLHFLHEECRIVHLDLKPENILMGSSMRPKIADFGLSRIFGEQQTRIVTNNRAGTCGYMAPEYLNRGLVSNKADIFSLGVILIEIITGSRDYPYFHQDNPQRDDTFQQFREKVLGRLRRIIGRRAYPYFHQDNPHRDDTSFQQFTEKVLGRWRNKFTSTPKYKSMEKYMQQVKQCVTIALQCVDPSMEKRPNAKDIMQVLNAVDQTIPRIIQIIDDTAGAIWCIDAHQTESLIITGHNNGCVMIWNYDTQKVVAPIKVSHEAVYTVKFIARKRWLVAVSDDCFVHVYKYDKELEKVTSFKVHDYHDRVLCSLDVHPTQPYVLSGCATEIKLWDWDQDWNCIQTFEEHSSSISELKLNPEDTNSFASASHDNTVKVWSLDSPKSKYTLSGHSDVLNCLDFFKHDGQQYLISGSYDKTAKIWDMQKEESVHTLEHESIVYFVFAHPNLPVLITGTIDGDVRVWSSTDFRLKTKLGVPTSVRGFACLMGSERVAVAHLDGVSLMEIGDEEGQGGSEGSNVNSI